MRTTAMDKSSSLKPDKTEMQILPLTEQKKVYRMGLQYISSVKLHLEPGPKKTYY